MFSLRVLPCLRIAKTIILLISDTQASSRPSYCEISLENHIQGNKSIFDCFFPYSRKIFECAYKHGWSYISMFLRCLKLHLRYFISHEILLDLILQPMNWCVMRIIHKDPYIEQCGNGNSDSDWDRGIWYIMWFMLIYILVKLMTLSDIAQTVRNN